MLDIMVGELLAVNHRQVSSKTGYNLSGIIFQQMVEAIHLETQRLDDSGHSVHSDMGVFLIVLTSHGDEGCIIGSDRLYIRLTDIYDLLSPRNFPVMRGRPKIIIIQACAGGKL